MSPLVAYLRAVRAVLVVMPMAATAVTAAGLYREAMPTAEMGEMRVCPELPKMAVWVATRLRGAGSP
ncbi:hypothetical protein CU276_11000 [Yersinia kristensenii]|nr:hypothetical protein CU276_11000 [Yersinia kristensenii]